MAAKGEEREITDEEMRHAFAAIREWRLIGKTDHKCPLCGGELRFLVVGNSYEIRCEKDGCFKLTSRGL